MTDAQTHYKQGQEYRKQGKLDEAIAEFEELLKRITNAILRDNFMEAVSVCEEFGGRTAEVLKVGLLKYIQAVIEERQTREEMREAMLETGLFKASKIDQYVQFLAEKCAIAHYNRGNAHKEKKQYSKAIEEYKAAIRLNPEDFEAYHHLGHAYGNKGMKDKAISALEEAVELKPDHIQLHRCLAEAYEKRGLVDKAEAERELSLRLEKQELLPRYRAGVQGEPDSEVYHYLLGWCLEDLDEALQEFQKSVELNPHYKWGHYALGVIYWRKGQLEDAIAAFKEAVRLKPDWHKARLDLGNVYREQGQLDNALAEYQEVIKQEPEHKSAHHFLGHTYFAKGMLTEAATAWEDAAKDPEKDEHAQQAQHHLEWLNRHGGEKASMRFNFAWGTLWIVVWLTLTMVQFGNWTLKGLMFGLPCLLLGGMCFRSVLKGKMFRDMAKRGGSEFIAFLRDRKIDDISACLVDCSVAPPWRQKRKLPEMPDVLNIATLKGHGDGTHLVRFSPDGQLLASASEEIITLWDVSTKEENSTIEVNTHGDICFSPDGNLLAIGLESRPFKQASPPASVEGGEVKRSSPGFVKLWDIAAKQEVVMPKTQWARKIRNLRFSPDGRFLAAVSEEMSSRNPDETVSLWDMSTKEEIATLKGTAVAFSHDSALLALGGNVGEVKLWDIATKGEIATLKGLRGKIEFVCFSPDGGQLAAAAGNIAQKWDVASGRVVETKKEDKPVSCIHFNPAGRLFVARREAGIAACAGFNAEGTLLATISSYREVHLIKTDTQEKPSILEAHAGKVTSICFSPDGRLLATSSEDGTVLLWDVSPYLSI